MTPHIAGLMAWTFLAAIVIGYVIGWRDASRRGRAARLIERQAVEAIRQQQYQPTSSALGSSLARAEAQVRLLNESDRRRS